MPLTPSQFRILILTLGSAAIGADFLRNDAFFILKPLCTIAILIFAIAYRNLSLKNYALQIAIGLFFCLLGDCFLLIDAYFIYGLLSFLMAHLIFLYAFIKRQGWQWRPEVAVLLLFFAGAVFSLISKDLGTLFNPVLIYLIVIVLMSWQGWAMTLNPKMEQRRFLGGAVSLFLVSDSLIAINKFSYPFSLSGVLILATYWFAIYFIAHSATRYS